MADVVQAVGAVLSLKWIQSGKVEVGTFCTVQGEHIGISFDVAIATFTFTGIIKIFGATGVAFSTLVTPLSWGI